MEGNLSLTFFDTLNGNQTYTADLTGNMLVNTEALNGACSVIFSDNVMDTLTTLIAAAGMFGEDADESIELLPAFLTGLKDMEIIMTREGLAWVHAPILDELSGEENLWGAMDLGAELGELMFAEMGTTTLGSVLATVPSGDSVEEMALVCALDGYMDRLYGDDKFTTSGGTATRTIGMDEMAALYKDMGLDPDEIKDIWKEYSLTMKVDSTGAATVTGVMETRAQLGVPAVRVTVDSTRNGQSAAMTMKIHVANLGEMELTLTASQQTTDEAPKTEPPEGAVIVDIESEGYSEAD